MTTNRRTITQTFTTLPGEDDVADTGPLRNWRHRCRKSTTVIKSQHCTREKNTCRQRRRQRVVSAARTHTQTHTHSHARTYADVNKPAAGNQQRRPAASPRVGGGRGSTNGARSIPRGARMRKRGRPRTSTHCDTHSRVYTAHCFDEWAARG